MAISARPAPAVERRGILMATLFAAQVCGSTGHSMSMAVGGILAADITGTNAWTGLPGGGRLGPAPLAIARHFESPAIGRPVGPARSLTEILTEPRVRIAVATLMLSQLVMIGTTSTSPVYLHDQGHGVSVIGLAVA